MKKIIGILKLDNLTKEVELSDSFYESYRILNEFAEMCLTGEGLTEEEKSNENDFDNELDKQYSEYYSKYLVSLKKLFEDTFNIELEDNFSEECSREEILENKVIIEIEINR